MIKILVAPLITKKKIITQNINVNVQKTVREMFLIVELLAWLSNIFHHICTSSMYVCVHDLLQTKLSTVGHCRELEYY